jgi:NAD dependent epimerase/dehydratase family enzyme
MSWIAMPDLLGVIGLALDREDVEGPMNVVAPGPVRNRDFARALGLVLGRPAWIPAPAPALKLLFGEMADEALLSSARAEPARLTALGYDFGFRDIEGALRHAVKASEKVS